MTRIGQEYRSTPEARAESRYRRDMRREAGDCVNHDRVPATHGCRCEPCAVRHGGYRIDPSEHPMRVTEIDQQLAAAALAAPRSEEWAN